MIEVPLNPGLPDGDWACLRPLAGHDEIVTDGAGIASAAQLLDRLLVQVPGTSIRPGKAWDLAICDRDRLLASVYRRCFGDRIEGTSLCRRCGERFDLGFSLAALIDSHAPNGKVEVEGPDREGVFSLENGCRFRLPNSHDQRKVQDLEPQSAVTALLEACVVEATQEPDPDRLQAAMEQVGPVLAEDLEASCPNCGAEQRVPFDIQSFLLQALAREKPFLTREVHRIAMAYRWSLDEILGLSREERRTYVRHIEADAGSPGPGS